MRNIFALLIVVSMLLIGCATTSQQPTGKIPEDAIIGHWKDALNHYDDHYFSQDGKSTTVSPIGDYFLGSYEIVRQNTEDRLLEVKIVDQVPGGDKVSRRRILGEFSEDYKIFSGKSLVASGLPFSFEYVDDQQSVVNAETNQLIKDLKEIKKDLGDTYDARAIIREKVANIESDYKMKVRDLGAKIEELQLQIDGLREQITSSVKVPLEQEEDQTTPNIVE